MSHKPLSSKSRSNPRPGSSISTSKTNLNKTKHQHPGKILPHKLSAKTSPAHSLLLASASTASPPSSSTSQLAQTHALLNALHIRHKNQHRSQAWFKHFNLLRKAISTLHSIETELERSKTITSTSNGINQNTTTKKASATAAPVTLSTTRNTNQRTTTTTSTASAPESESSLMRRRFEHESSLRRQRETWEEWTREVVVPKVYIAFGAVVKETQFANLGVVLVAILADVAGVVGLPSVEGGKRWMVDKDERLGGLGRRRRVMVKSSLEEEANHGKVRRGGQDASGGQEKIKSFTGYSTKVTGEDRGEVVRRVYGEVSNEGQQMEMEMGMDTQLQLQLPVHDHLVSDEDRLRVHTGDDDTSSDQNDLGVALMRDEPLINVEELGAGLDSRPVMANEPANHNTEDLSKPEPNTPVETDDEDMTNTLAQESDVSGQRNQPDVIIDEKISKVAARSSLLLPEEEMPINTTTTKTQTEKKKKKRSPPPIESRLETTDNSMNRKSSTKDKKTEDKQKVKKKKKVNAIDDLFAGFG